MMLNFLHIIICGQNITFSNIDMGLIVFIVIACLELVIMDLKLMNFTYWDVDRLILLFLLRVQIIHLVLHIFRRYLVVGELYTFLKYGANFMTISLQDYEIGMDLNTKILQFLNPDQIDGRILGKDF